MANNNNKTTVLLVDDSASIREMVGYTLRGADYAVIEATDGVEALHLAGEHEVNLVVTDINMPNMDGITLISELRKLPGFKFTPILTLTTEEGVNIKQQGKKAGATGWIVKPFDPDSLLSTIQRVL